MFGIVKVITFNESFSSSDLLTVVYITTILFHKAGALPMLLQQGGTPFHTQKEGQPCQKPLPRPYLLQQLSLAPAQALPPSAAQPRLSVSSPITGTMPLLFLLLVLLCLAKCHENSFPVGT